MMQGVGSEIRHDCQDQKDSKDHAGRPGKHVTSLGAERGVATGAAKGAGQSSASTFLDQHQQNQKEADDDEKHDSDIEKKAHRLTPRSGSAAALTIARKLS